MTLEQLIAHIAECGDAEHRASDKVEAEGLIAQLPEAERPAWQQKLDAALAGHGQPGSGVVQVQEPAKKRRR